MVFPISENFYLIWPAKKRKIRNIPIKAQALLRWAKVAIQNYKRQELGLGVKLLKVFLLLFNQRLSSINGCSPSNVVLHKRSSSTEVVSSFKVFHGKLFFTFCDILVLNASLTSKVVFQPLSPLQKNVFHQSLSFIKSLPPPKVVFLPLKGVIH